MINLDNWHVYFVGLHVHQTALLKIVMVSLHAHQEKYLICHPGWRVHFTKLDLSQAYQQVQLDPESQQFVTIDERIVSFGTNSLPSI